MSQTAASVSGPSISTGAKLPSLGKAERKNGAGHRLDRRVGRFVARKLGQASARVLVHSRDAERGARVVADIEASGGAADFLAAESGAPWN
jgi:hypothetical protein